MMKNVKRILSAMVAGALLCTGTAFSTVSAEESILLRDFNSSGQVDATDAVYVLNYYNSVIMGNEDTVLAHLNEKGVDNLSAGDVTGDGLVDSDDAVCMLKYYSTSLIFPDMTPDEIWEEVFAGK